MIDFIDEEDVDRINFEVDSSFKQTEDITEVFRPCDTDLYVQNIISSNISEILLMCITDCFKMLSCSCAIKTLNLKFLRESKVKKKFV